MPRPLVLLLIVAVVGLVAWAIWYYRPTIQFFTYYVNRKTPSQPPIGGFGVTENPHPEALSTDT